VSDTFNDWTSTAAEQLSELDRRIELAWQLLSRVYSLSACRVLPSCGRVEVLQLFCFFVFSLHTFCICIKTKSLIWSDRVVQVSNQSPKRKNKLKRS